MKNSFVMQLLQLTAIVICLGFALCLEELFGSEHKTTSNPKKEVTLPDGNNNFFQWEPTWRSPSDCGPMALYSLMKLCGHDTTLQEVSEAIELEPKVGCSMNDLLQGSKSLSFPAEARFINPNSLTAVPPPFIVHLKGSLKTGVGHFLLIVDYSDEKKQFAMIDTDRDFLGWVPKDSVLSLFSGYVLIPKGIGSNNKVNVLLFALLLASSYALVRVLWRPFPLSSSDEKYLDRTYTSPES